MMSVLHHLTHSNTHSLLPMLSSLDFGNEAPSWLSSCATGCFLSASSAGACSPPQLLSLQRARPSLGLVQGSVYANFPGDGKALNALSVVTIPNHVSSLTYRWYSRLV